MKKAFQREALDEETRNRLWNVLDENYLSKAYETQFLGGFTSFTVRAKAVKSLCIKMYDEHWKQRYDGKNDDEIISLSISFVKSRVLNKEWWEALDSIEYILINKNLDGLNLSKALNNVFEEENCAYRVIDHQIIEVTDEQEIAAIELAIEDGSKPVVTHLRQALSLLSDRKQPDYRNSMKESISAVEAHCRLLLGNDKLTLGQALKQIKQRMNLHPALEESVSKLYGFTSDSGGIRHSLTEGTVEPDYAEAKFMLVACTNFINFLRLKSADRKL